MDPVISVVIIHRHGARFPKNGYPGDLSFPNPNTEFWKTNKETLLRAGHAQLFALGVELGTELRTMKFHQELLQNIQVYSTNTQRTVASVVALLEGLVPERSLAISEVGDRQQALTNCVPILVEKNLAEDQLFFGGSSEQDLKGRKMRNLQASTEIQDLARSPQVQNLCNKLFVMTKDKSLSPRRDAVERCAELFEMFVRFEISNCSNFPFLGNQLGLKLDRGEIALLEACAHSVASYHFRPASNLVAEEYGSLVAVNLLSRICEFLWSSEGGLHIYSAHDTTLLALSAMLGWIIPIPGFAAYYILERTFSGKLYIKFNADTENIRLCTLLPIRWEEREFYVPYNEAFGDTNLEKFCAKFLLENRTRSEDLGERRCCTSNKKLTRQSK